MQVHTREHEEIMEQFEKDVQPGRLDKEPRENWKRGIVYQNGEVNAMFQVYRMGYSLGRSVYLD